ncbi:zinc finger protein 39 isoform X2 [Lingula anatina]|uniref:Zinc finger protein 39 isoform X2 n=1 Tax=Lingula anatina TaxID=7574 RepID=A0A1S3K2U3_LINAN|nr:zinc finger protein 39 isoform X2 [Lingula anatina]|eukprot:XP_013416842.1 zinc finger protein 39 isoform X2 [Lingula anatina]
MKEGEYKEHLRINDLHVGFQQQIKTEEETPSQENVIRPLEQFQEVGIGINIGQELPRWNALKDRLQLETNENLAKFLMDHYLKNNTLTLKPFDISYLPPDNNIAEDIDSNSEVVDSFPCDKCHRVYTRRDSLKRHMKKHSSTETYDCDHCEETFPEKQALQRHLQKKHSGILHPCSQCDKIFNTKAGLRTHENSHFLEDGVPKATSLSDVPVDLTECTSNPIPPSPDETRDAVPSGADEDGSGMVFQCRVSGCERVLSSKCALQKHNRTHTGIYPFNCLECPRGFHARSALEDHRRSRHKEKRFHCVRCNKTFCTGQGRKLHEQLHRNESHQCHLCEKTFPTKIYLKIHLRTHIESFECTICKKSYTKARHLKDHMAFHNNKTFDCNKCTFKTNYRQSYNRHLKAHKREIQSILLSKY